MAGLLDITNSNFTLNYTMDAVEFASQFENNSLESDVNISDVEILQATQQIEQTLDFIDAVDDVVHDDLILATQVAEENNRDLNPPAVDDNQTVSRKLL